MPRTSRTTSPLPLRLLRAVASLIALTALLAGVPLLLLVAGTLPGHMPSGGEIGTALTAPDDGLAVLFTLLTLLAWGLWLWFCAATVLEAAALLHRRPPRQSRGFAAPQRLAAFLLGGLLVLPAGTAAMAAQPAAAVTATHLPQQQASSDSEAAAAGTSAARHTAQAPVHVVGDVPETVWGIAQAALGDGRRSADIRALNPHLPQSTVLPSGTVVRLPADARISSPEATPVSTSTTSAPSTAPGAATPVTDPAEAPAQQGTQLERSQQSLPSGGHVSDEQREYTVEPGDNLSRIAQDQLGDAARWPELFDANKGEQQPYGHRFDNPDLIYPGQEITVPGPTTEHPKQETPKTQPEPPADQGHTPGTADRDETPAATPDTTSGTDSSASPDTAATTPAPSASVSAAESALPSPTVPPSSTPNAPDTSAPAVASPAPASRDNGQQAGVFGLLATGVLAAGFLSVLGYRRLAQMRRRRRGHHIALPQGDAARTEHAMSVTEAIIDTAVLDPVLRTMAVHLADADRELPEVAALVLGDRDIVLHLVQPAAPVPPFTASPEQLARWSCPVNTAEVLPADETGDVEEPYPALVSLGWDTDGRLVLIDLEHVGHLHLTGPGADAVLRTLALELATTEFAHHLDLALVGDTVAPGLAEERAERVTQRTDLAAAAAALRAHHSDQQRALSLLGATTLRQARTGVDTAAAWTPSLVIASTPEQDDAEGIEDLLQTVAAEPRTATAVLTAGAVPPGASGHTVWILHADPEVGPVRLPIDGVDIDCTLQALSDEHYAYALEILSVSRTEDVPAPQPEAPAVKSTVLETSEASAGDEEPPAATPSPASATATRVPNLLAQFAALDDEEDGSPTSDGGDAAGESSRDARQPSDDEPAAVRPLPPTQLEEEGEPTADTNVVILDKTGQPPAASPSSVPTQQAPARTVSIQLPDGASALSEASLPESGLPPAGPETGELDPPIPLVRVLGPVDVIGARGTLTEKKRQRTYTELCAWLVLHPGHHAGALDHRALDEALWPDKDEVSVKYRNAVVSRTRTWLGRDDSDQPYIPLLKTADSRYSISPAVGCDWHDFQQFAQAGKDPRTEDPDLALRQALELVRGRPFSSADRRRYKWAEHLALVMTMDIVDVAEILAERRLAAHDPRGALWAATKGLEVAPVVESLHRILFQAYAAIGDYVALERAATWLEEWTENNEMELDDETLAVLDQLRAKA